MDFVAYGDVRHHPAVHREIAGQIAKTKPKFLLVTGDYVDHPDAEDEWAVFREIVRPLRALGGYHAAVGDHDVGPREIFRKEFSLDGLYFDRHEGGLHVFVLDSRSLDAKQLEWLEKTAAVSAAKHKFAVFHHPPFMIDRDRGHEAERVRVALHPILVKHKFCAAFCGHQHSFYTTKRDGVRYVITAGGGATLWKIDPTLGEKGDLSREFYHFVGCSIEGGKIAARVFDREGGEAADLAFTLCEHP